MRWFLVHSIIHTAARFIRAVFYREKNMKFVHLSDLHLGKRVGEFSMLEEQKHILAQIIGIIAEEKPDGVFIAGDIYDKALPSAEAVVLFDDFLVQLAALRTQVFIISGNHDSPERLAFGNRLIDAGGIHISPVYSGEIKPFSIVGECGTADIYMLPFIKPANVRACFPDEKIESYTDAVRLAVDKMRINKSSMNILLTHQFVTGAERSDSEDKISVGGTDNVDASVFDGFDYVALGHIHKPQNIGTERIRYCGTPLKYSFSEAGQDKSVTVAELNGKRCLNVRTIPLVPLHDMHEISGKYAELTLKSFYEKTTYMNDYMHITLTDEDDIPDAVMKLRTIYRNLMKLDYDNTRTRHSADVNGAQAVESKSPLELFSEFFELRNGSEMSPEQSEFMAKIIESVWEEEE